MFMAWLASSCWAVPLWVAPETVEQAEAALEELWPGGTLEVRATPMESGATGLLWDGSQLVWSSEEGTYVERAPDLATAVLIARTWLREHPDAELGWIPMVELELPEERPDIAPPPITPARLAIGVGPGLQMSPGRGQRFDGPRVSMSALFSHTELGLTVFISPGRETPLTLVERVVEGKPGVVVKTTFETVVATVQASWDLGAGPLGNGPSRRVLYAPHVEPRLTGGFEIRDGYVRRLTVENLRPEYSSSASYFDLGPVVGIGADLWLGAVGVRALAGQRFGFFTPEGLGLSTRSFFALDVVARISPTARDR